jgi:hypothetical protein
MVALDGIVRRSANDCPKRKRMNPIRTSLFNAYYQFLKSQINAICASNYPTPILSSRFRDHSVEAKRELAVALLVFTFLCWL